MYFCYKDPSVLSDVEGFATINYVVLAYFGVEVNWLYTSFVFLILANHKVEVCTTVQGPNRGENRDKKEPPC